MKINRKRIRTKLETRRADLVKKMKEGQRGLKPQPGANPDRSSLAQSYTSQQMRIRYYDKIQKQIRQLDSALTRLEKDKYGYCENCEEKISPERLDVMPQATMCVSCQADQESRL